MRLILAIVILVCAIDSFAAVAASPVATNPRVPRQTTKKKDLSALVGASVGLVAEKSNDNRSYVPETMFGLRAGVEYRRHEFLLEVAGFRNSSSSSGVNITRQHEQVDLWYRYLFLPYDPNGHPFFGVGLGGQRDRVKTDFFNRTADDTGRIEPQLSVAGGYRINLHEVAAIWLEGRLATSSNYEPRVLPSGLVGLAARF